MLPLISENKIQSNYQFGFRTQYPTIHQAYRLVDSVSFALEKKNCIVLVFFWIFNRPSTEYGTKDFFTS
jgi:hypothetical protein